MKAKSYYVKYNFENLEIYSIANRFIVDIYDITSYFPNKESFGLTSQIRRAAVSVVLNIVEGSGRGSKKDFSRFINLAIGSLFEVKAGLILSVKLSYLPQKKLEDIFPEIDKLFFKLVAFKKTLVKDKLIK